MIKERVCRRDAFRSRAKKVIRTDRLDRTPILLGAFFRAVALVRLKRQDTGRRGNKRIIIVRRRGGSTDDKRPTGP